MSNKTDFQILRDEHTQLVNDYGDLYAENFRLREAIQRERNMCWQIARDFENWTSSEFERVYGCQTVSDAIAIAPQKAV